MEHRTRIELTALLKHAADTGSRSERAWEILYSEVLKLAGSQRRRWDGDWTMETGALANEAFIKVFGGGMPDLADRQHFYRLVATAIRQILINYGVAQGAAKRGGNSPHVPLEVADALGLCAESAAQVRDLDRALERLREMDPRGAEVVELKFFVGLGNREIAEVLGVSRPTVIRDWAAARAWLWKEMGEGSPSGPPAED